MNQPKSRKWNILRAIPIHMIGWSGQNHKSHMIPTHGLNHLAQAANANVCASFHLGNTVKWKTPHDSNNGGLA